MREFSTSFFVVFRNWYEEVQKDRSGGHCEKKNPARRKQKPIYEFSFYNHETKVHLVFLLNNELRDRLMCLMQGEIRQACISTLQLCAMTLLIASCLLYIFSAAKSSIRIFLMFFKKSIKCFQLQVQF